MDARPAPRFPMLIGARGASTGGCAGRRGAGAVAAGLVVLALATGTVAAFSFWLGRSADLPPARPFTSAAKRALVAELEAALALTRRYTATTGE